jgi:hypothetical protein
LRPEDEAEAIARLLNGEAEPIDDGLEYVEVCENLGLPTDEYPDLAEKLTEMGIPVNDAVIPSIRQVTRIS